MNLPNHVDVKPPPDGKRLQEPVFLQYIADFQHMRRVGVNPKLSDAVECGVGLRTDEPEGTIALRNLVPSENQHEGLIHLRPDVGFSHI